MIMTDGARKCLNSQEGKQQMKYKLIFILHMEAQTSN